MIITAGLAVTGCLFSNTVTNNVYAETEEVSGVLKETEIKPVKEGWINEGGSYKYYKNNVAYTGWHYMGVDEGESKAHWSYFGNDGVLRTGWQQFGQGTSDPDGNSKKHWSYFDTNGWLTTEWKYFSNAEGEKEEHYSYFGGNGWLRTGSQTIGGKNYYFNVSGWMTYPEIMQIDTGSGQEIEKRVSAKVSSMTLEEKIAQMFIITPSQIGKSVYETSTGEVLKTL